jgi:hypothetical protein
MTPNSRIADEPVPADLAAIAALLDGEQVDADAVKQALSTAAGRDYLVDVLVLRQAVPAMNPSPAALAPEPRRFSIGRWATAAALLLVVSGSSFLVGRTAGFVAEADTSSTSVIAVAESEGPRAPSPTHVVQLEPGVNWHSEGGQ